MPWKTALEKTLSKHFIAGTKIIEVSPVGGGDINEAYRLTTTAGLFFVKKNSASLYPQMFQKEALGLEELAHTDEIPVPEIVLSAEIYDDAFLVLKYIESANKSHDFWDDFGKRLANLHKHSADQFGLDHSNYIGSLYQSNNQHNTWTEFYREERLEPQVKLARNNGKAGRDIVLAFDRFYNKLDELFPKEAPSLVHGDLWGGNFMVNEQGKAVIIDPAVYYGHREMDIGMSRLFGGFSDDFYTAYNRQYPLEKGWRKRTDYCNLYPLMVHVNLFGGGYLGSVKSILKKF